MNERTYYSKEARTQAKREIALFILIALSAGAGVGSVLALLFAPQKGEVLREEISETMEDRMNTMEKQMRDLKHRLEDRVASIN